MTDFEKLFAQVCRSHSPWEVFQDLTAMMALALNCNAPVDLDKRDEREAEYMRIVSHYAEDDRHAFAHMFAAVIDELERDPEQDYLGMLYMVLGLGDSWKGQIFTPYSVCKAMTDFTMRDHAEELQRSLEERGYVSFADPSVGAGATLIAVRNAINTQVPFYHCLFVGQDISYTACHMAYTQLALLGCCGYIVCGDTLMNPVTMRGYRPVPGDYDIWTLPMTAVFHPRIRHAEKPSPVALGETENGQLCLF